jgi:hypothetical protein
LQHILPESSFLHDLRVFTPAIRASRLSCRPCRFPEEDWLSSDVPRGQHIVRGKAGQLLTKHGPFLLQAQ